MYINVSVISYLIYSITFLKRGDKNIQSLWRETSEDKSMPKLCHLTRSSPICWLLNVYDIKLLVAIKVKIYHKPTCQNRLTIPIFKMLKGDLLLKGNLLKKMHASSYINLRLYNGKLVVVIDTDKTKDICIFNLLE
jgi:hypothetical protein